MVWAGVVGSTVLAVRRGSTRRSVVRQAVALLDMVHARLAGSVLILPGRRRRAKAQPAGTRPTDDDVEAAAAIRTAMARPRESDQG